ncbi:major facilitator superfamily domain-containing protein [Halteromyces radiatus]|uniref:major facilitator superfamily domain-containing protein n=1 Tax=Halteromyces radiatus TaxID=101107 RepID=UPI00221E6390|nr:major facilitator superfamily domain-containing protein [Halteromyces radiatus]KAI8076865.1 major facilitator superfamily domain-containing protein [Halteromyces radiatus]
MDHMITCPEEKNMATTKVSKETSDTSDDVSSSTHVNAIQAPFIKSPVEKALVRKIHRTVLPFVFGCVFIQYADKSVLSAASVLGMLDDTNVTPTEYSILGSIFYVGFISWQLPNNYLLQRVPSVSKYLGFLLTLWGIVLSLTCLARNFAELAVLRVLLGLFEASTYPCLLIIVNTMYRREEQPRCFGFLWMSNGFGVIFANVLSYGIAHMDMARNIRAWQWNFIILGVLTVLLGISVFFFLPDQPKSKLFHLTAEEELIVEDRIQDNSVVRKRIVNYAQYWETVKEIRFWLLCLTAFCIHLPNGGLVVFGNPFVKSLGFSSLDAILLQLPVGAIVTLYVAFVILVEYKTKQLVWTACITSVISMIGCLLLAVLPHQPIKLFAYYLSWAFNGTYAILLTTIGSNVKGYSKKIFYNGGIMIFYTLGNFVGPLLMMSNESPAYKSGMIAFTVAMFIVILSLITARFWMARRNDQRKHNHGQTDAYLDQTDTQDTFFIYRL